MKRWKPILAATAAALIALPPAWYYGSPWWTLWRIREASRAGDVETFKSYVDLETIGRRTAVENWAFSKSLMPYVRQETEGGRQFLARMKREMAEARHPRPAEIEELRPWLANIPIQFGASRDKYEPYIVHGGVDAFEVRQRGASRESGPLLAFRRHGLGWKLEYVRWGQQ